MRHEIVMKYEVDDSYSTGLVIATPSLEKGVLGAFRYEQTAAKTDNPVGEFVLGHKAKIFNILPKTQARIKAGDFTAMDAIVVPEPGLRSAFVVKRLCHFFPVDEEHEYFTLLSPLFEFDSEEDFQHYASN